MTKSYLWQAEHETQGLGSFGAWRTTTTYSNGLTLKEYANGFGQELGRTDLGGADTVVIYDRGGRVVERRGLNGVIETMHFTNLNSGLVAGTRVGWVNVGNDYRQRTQSFAYDAAGARTREQYRERTGERRGPGNYVQTDDIHSDATVSYDGLGRMASWSEVGGPTLPWAKMNWAYDAVGNIVRTGAEYRTLNEHGGLAENRTSDWWYRFDAMGRVVTGKGALVNVDADGRGRIVRGDAGVDVTYNAAGERMSATRTLWRDDTIHNPNGTWNGDQYEAGAPTRVDYQAEVRETYGYDAGSRLTSVHVAESTLNDHGDGTYDVGGLGSARQAAAFEYDKLGRRTRQRDYAPGHVDPVYDRRTYYHNPESPTDGRFVLSNRVTEEIIDQLQGGVAVRTRSVNRYDDNVALGAVVSNATTTHRGGQWHSDANTTNSYAWREGAQLTKTVYAQSDQPVRTSTYRYDAGGRLEEVKIADGRPREVRFVNDMAGQALRRDETDALAGGDPHEVWYRFNGRELGYSGNAGADGPDYASSVTQRTDVPGQGAFRRGGTAQSASFDPDIAAFTSFTQGSERGGYTVRAGDTLAGIAQRLWGDGSLWYKLAEANPAQANGALVAGTILIVPAGVSRSTLIDNGNGTHAVGALGTAALAATFEYDGRGRRTLQRDYRRPEHGAPPPTTA